MFRCQLCDSVVPKGVRSSRLIVQTRSKTYAPRGANPAVRRGGFRGRSRTRTKPNFDKGGQGTEIVRELMVCTNCAEQHAQEKQAAEQEAAERQAAEQQAAEQQVVEQETVEQQADDE